MSDGGTIYQFVEITICLHVSYIDCTYITISLVRGGGGVVNFPIFRSSQEIFASCSFSISSNVTRLHFYFTRHYDLLFMFELAFTLFFFTFIYSVTCIISVFYARRTGSPFPPRAQSCIIFSLILSQNLMRFCIFIAKSNAFHFMKQNQRFF